MINYQQVKSTVRPQEIEITENQVFIASNIEEYEEVIDDHTIQGYKYNYVSYTKDEYILMQQAHYVELAEELEATKILLGVE